MNGKLAWGAVAAVALIGSGAVSASIPSEDGTIDACVNNATGAMRVIDEDKPGTLGSCITTGLSVLRETPISWNQTGRQGRPGASFGYAREVISGLDNELVFFSEVGGLTVACDAEGNYDVKWTTDATADPHLWIERSSTNTIDHVVPADIGDGVAEYEVQVDGVADERLQLSASNDETVVNWDVLATTDGGCRLHVITPTLIEPPSDPRDDGDIIFD